MMQTNSREGGTMRAGIYARISEDRDETQLGVQRQIDDCEQLAAKRSWEVVDRYVDNDVSAYKGKRRPEYERMLADIRAGRLDALAAWHLDRLHRQPRELEAFFDVCDQAGGVAMATVSGDVDLATDDGRFHARIMGAVARKSSDDQSRRLQRKALEVAMSGGSTGGGTRPFGFESDRVTIRPDEATIIRELAERLLAGETLRSLCVDLNARGITSPTGKPWIPTPLRRMLHSARISGQREHRGEIVAAAKWPAIITPEQTTRIRALIDNPARRATRAPRAYLLKGLVRCGQCNARMVARPRDDGRRRYVCARGPGFVGCGKSYVLAEPLEELAAEAVLWRLDSPELAKMIRSENDNGSGHEWQEKADTLTGRLDELAVAFANGDVTMREWRIAREPLQQQLDDAQRNAARDSRAGVLSEHVGHAGELRKRWPELGIDRQHAIVSGALAHVVVNPGRRGFNRFDPQRFDLAWRY